MKIKIFMEISGEEVDAILKRELGVTFRICWGDLKVVKKPKEESFITAEDCKQCLFSWFENVAYSNITILGNEKDEIVNAYMNILPASLNPEMHSITSIDKVTFEFYL